MTASPALELLAQLRAKGIRVAVHDGKLRLQAEKGALDAKLRDQLTLHKADIVALLSADTADYPPLEPARRDQPLPLSYAQQRLWFLDELEPGTPVYNMPFVLHTQGRIEHAALQAALDDLIQQHESLRTVFTATGSEPVQQVLDRLILPVKREDLRGADQQAVTARLRELASESFSLATGPLFNVHVLQTGPESHLLLLVIHHIIADLWSLDIFFRDLGKWYAHHLDGSTPPPANPTVQYADYAVWQRQLMHDDRLQRDLNYWTTQLADAPAVLELSTDYPRPAEPGYKGSWRSITLPDGEAEKLRALAQSRGVTMFMLCFAAFAALLHKYSGETDMVVGTPISGRQKTELEQLIGFFLNTLALRVMVTPETRFGELLADVRNTALKAYAHQDLPFEKLVEELQPERDMSHTPVFQHMFIWRDANESRLQMPGLEAEPATLIGHDTAKFDLTLAMTGTRRTIEAGFEFNTDLFAATTIERMLLHLQRLLEHIAANPDIAIADIDLLDSGERNRILHDFNATTIDFGADSCVHTLITEQTHQLGNAPAVQFGSETLSYSALAERTDALAAELQARGAGPGSIVAICCYRSLELPVAALAVVKSGACYVPIDPAYPADRIAAMLGDSNARIILTQADIDLPAHNADVIRLDSADRYASGARVAEKATPGDALYCIYTSGSTGTPKGVQLSHRGLANLLRWQRKHERLGKAARTLQFASFSFDVSFQEFFSTWSTGGTVVMITEELRQDLPALAGFIAAQGIERLYLPYAALQPIAETLVAMQPDLALQDVVIAGEQLLVTPAVRALFDRLPAAALHNQYGPSETHVVTALTMTGAAQSWPALPSIGTPIANTRAYVLDPAEKPVPIGLPGELYLGGIQVALGYLHRPDLNTQKFVVNPFRPDEKLYKTGDRVRFLDSGELEFLGRIDDQFKWRGFRIEPGEIETALTELPQVTQASVILRNDGPGGNQLVAYVTGSAELDSERLRSGLRQTLPEYMVPGVFMQLDALPLTPSGKVARRRLPAPDYAEAARAAYVAPRNETEAGLVEIWSEVLGVGQAGIHDDFFALGGHSLLATQLVARIRDRFKVNLPLKFIFRYPTPGELAETVSTLQTSLQGAAVSPAAERDEFRI